MRIRGGHRRGAGGVLPAQAGQLKRDQVVSVLLLIGGLCLLIVWIDGGIDDSMDEPISYLTFDD